MADEEDESPREDESAEGEARDSDDEDASSQETTAPGEWEREPGDESEMRHDDDVEPPADPDESTAEDEAEQEAGDAGGDDKGYDEPEAPDHEEVGDAGKRLEDEAEPLLEGPELKTPIGAVPTRSLAGMAAFVVVFCVAFFAIWALLDDAFGVFLGIVVGAGLGFFAMKLFADRERATS